MKTSRAQLAADALRIKQADFSKLEKETRNLFCLILEKYGEKGICIPDDEPDGAYVPYAEPEPGEFAKVSRIRYCHERLQVKAKGLWIDYEDAMMDTWFIIDTLIDILEKEED